MFNSGLIQLAKINEPKTFEQLCRDVLYTRFGWEAKLYGRKGQKQYGIDIVAPIEADLYVAAQCKNYLKKYSSTQGETIKCDLDDASQQQYIKISKYYIMTTLEREAKLQNFIIGIAKNYPFAIDILFWDDIQEIICSSQELLRKYYPGMQNDMRIPIAVENRIIADLAYLQKGAEHLYQNYQNYRHALHYGADMTLYRSCVGLFNVTQDLYNLVNEYYIQFRKRRVVDEINKIIAFMPEFHDESQDGTGSNMLYTNTDYIGFFTSKETEEFITLCRITRDNILNDVVMKSMATN